MDKQASNNTDYCELAKNEGTILLGRGKSLIYN
jgi:hypothetical protein